MTEQINLTKNVTIELTPAQLQLTISMLRKGAYDQVVGVLNSIELQVVKQMKAEVVTTNGVEQ